MQVSFDWRSFHATWYWVIVVDVFKVSSTGTQPQHTHSLDLLKRGCVSYVSLDGVLRTVDVRQKQAGVPPQKLSIVLLWSRALFRIFSTLYFLSDS